MKQKDSLLAALHKDIKIQKEYLEGEIIATIYFGGGTPSILSCEEIQNLLDKIYSVHKISENPEITLEANPDDLTKEYLFNLKNTGINRLSIGVQSFTGQILKFLNRRHTVEESLDCINLSREAGFNNINIDLIYGIPGLENKNWIYNLDKAFKLDVEHISAYHLTIEPKTVFAHYLKKGVFRPADESLSVEQFKILTSKMKDNNFIHYEISNFAKEGFFSRHNINYWLHEKYLGIGPSAHSYNTTSRHWNINNISQYIKSLENNKIPNVEEALDQNTKYNEYILTSLRTMWGIDMEYMKTRFGAEINNHCLLNAEEYINNYYLEQTNNNIILTDEGKLIADKICSDLFIVR